MQSRGTPLESLSFENLRDGTAPRSNPSNDFPVPSSFCADGGDSPVAKDPQGIPPGAGASDVGCDAGASRADAEAAATSVNLAGLGVGIPGLLIGRAESSVTSRLVADQGLVTTARASVESFRVLSDPPVSIGLLETEATTQAFGRIGLAGVQAESHYGVFRLPGGTADGGGGTVSDLGMATGAFGALLPETVEPYAIVPPSASAAAASLAGHMSSAGSGTAGFRFPRTVEEAIRLIVNSPAQAPCRPCYLPCWHRRSTSPCGGAV